MKPAAGTSATRTSGPLAGFRIVEFAGIGPGPFACMMLSDMGADVLRISRVGEKSFSTASPIAAAATSPSTSRTRRISPGPCADRRGRRADRRLPSRRHGTAGARARGGAGPQSAPGLRPHDRLGPGRPAGAGRRPRHQLHLAHRRAGRDRPADKPVPPLNLVGDFGGGALYLVVGVLAAVIEARRSGHGQVVDCAMVRRRRVADVDVLRAGGGRALDRRREPTCSTAARTSTASTNAPTASSSRSAPSSRNSTRCSASTSASTTPIRARGPRRPGRSCKQKLAGVFKTKTCDEWCALLEGTDVCFAPILTMEEAPNHPHIAGRQTFVERDGVIQPAPAPRFSRTPSAIRDAAKADLRRGGARVEGGRGR